MSETTEKLISVIIPCYNVSEYIDRCIDSLVNQTIGIDKLLCIFVDDASTDDTLDRLYVWEEKYPDSIMIIACEENGRQGRARNIGLEYAVGEYIGFVDSDDYISPEMYEKMYEAAKREDVDVVGCLMQREFQDGRVAWKDENYVSSGKRIDINDIKDRKKYIMKRLPGNIGCKLYKNTPELFEGLRFPEKMAYEDNYWGALLAFRIKSYYLINEAYYHYMINYGSTVMIGNSEHQMDRLVIELMKIEEFKRLGLFETYHDEIEREFLELFFINTLKTFFARFDEIPYDIIRTMQQNVTDLFPEYEKNIYIDEFNPLQKEFLKMIRVNMTNEQIDTLALAYRDVLRKYNDPGC